MLVRAMTRQLSSPAGIKKIKVIVGCFFGDLDEFAAAVQKTHGDNTHAKVYRLAIEMAKERIKMDDMPEESNDG